MTRATEPKWYIDGEGPIDESTLRKVARKNGLVQDNATMPIEDLIDWILECYSDVDIEPCTESEKQSD